MKNEKFFTTNVNATSLTIKDLCARNDKYKEYRNLCHVEATPVVTSRGSMGSMAGEAHSFMEIVKHQTSKRKGFCNLVREDGEVFIEATIDLRVELEKSLSGMKMSIEESDCQMRILEYRIKDSLSGDTILLGNFSIEDPENLVDKDREMWHHTIPVKSFKEGGDND